MSSISHADLIKAHPALAAYAVDKAEFWLAKADIFVTEDRFGKSVAAAKLAYAAHALVHTEAPIKGGKRVIPAHSKPPAPRTKNDKAKAAAAGSWKTTTHGRRLARMAKY